MMRVIEMLAVTAEQRLGPAVGVVAVDDPTGQEHTVRIVGIDEVDLNRRYISWISPLARALMKSSPGDRVVLRAPKKTEHLEILDVEYAPIPMDPFHVPPGAEAATSSNV